MIATRYCKLVERFEAFAHLAGWCMITRDSKLDNQLGLW